MSILSKIVDRVFSYRGKDVEWNIGTRPTESFGVALRKAHAKGF